MSDRDATTACHECDAEHADWQKTGSHVVNGPWHAGRIEHWECGRCGAITEVGRR